MIETCIGLSHLWVFTITLVINFLSQWYPTTFIIECSKELEDTEVPDAFSLYLLEQTSFLRQKTLDCIASIQTEAPYVIRSCLSSVSIIIVTIVWALVSFWYLFSILARKMSESSHIPIICPTSELICFSQKILFLIVEMIFGMLGMLILMSCHCFSILFPLKVRWLAFNLFIICWNDIKVVQGQSGLVFIRPE